jgi:hypothetical protein
MYEGQKHSFPDSNAVTLPELFTAEVVAAC